MKGVQFAVLTLFWAIAILMIVAGMNFFPALRQARTQDVLIKTDVYMMSSAMDAAQSYLGAALQYSNYQACYELLKKAGNKELTGTNKISFNDADYGFVPERQEFVGSLGSEIADNLNAYANMGYLFAKKYPVELPGYAVALAETADGVSAKATADKKMSSKMEVKGGNLDPEKSNVNGNVMIYRTADMDAKLRLDCLTIYDRVKEVADKVEDTIDKAINSELKLLASGQSSNTAESCQAMLGESINRVKDSIKGLSDQQITIEILDVKIIAELIPAERDNEGKYRCLFKSTGNSTVNARVTLKTGENVPVWNGEKIKYEEIVPVFLVEGGTKPFRHCVSSGGDSSISIICSRSCGTDRYALDMLFLTEEECINSLNDINKQYSESNYDKTLSQNMLTIAFKSDANETLPAEGITKEWSNINDAPPMLRTDTIEVAYEGGKADVAVICGSDNQCKTLSSLPIESLPDEQKSYVEGRVNEIKQEVARCDTDYIPCGPQAIYDALEDMDLNPDICEINEKRKPGLFTKFLSIFNKEALGITWPNNIISILKDYGMDVNTKSGLFTNNAKMIESIKNAIAAGKRIIARISLQKEHELLSQHYAFIDKDYINNPNFIIYGTLNGEFPIHEIYIISKNV